MIWFHIRRTEFSPHGFETLVDLLPNVDVWRAARAHTNVISGYSDVSISFSTFHDHVVTHGILVTSCSSYRALVTHIWSCVTETKIWRVLFIVSSDKFRHKTDHSWMDGSHHSPWRFTYRLHCYRSNNHADKLEHTSWIDLRLTRAPATNWGDNCLHCVDHGGNWVLNCWLMTFIFVV